MALLRQLLDLIGHIAALPAQRFTAFVDDAEDFWDVDPLLAD